MEIVEYMESGDYEQLVVAVDRNAGLKAFIAIHDTTLGPALGGCRIWPHPTEEAALRDVLRLSRAMTYKNAAAGLNLGGGKALIWADPRTDKHEGMMRAFGQFLEGLGGRYITTEDVGSTPEDLVAISQATSHVVGLPRTLGGSGDPSQATGFGIHRGMKVAARQALGTDSLAGVSIAIQGFGKVAGYLAEHLLVEGARLTVTDINPQAIERARALGCTIVEDPDAIYDVPCDIFSPCALGGSINRDTIPRLQARVVAGGANNQLQTEEDGEELQRRGILYAPDYLINAGGLINISAGIGSPYNPDRAREKTERIYELMGRVIQVSRQEEISTARAADRIAEDRLASVRAIKTLYRPR